MYNIKQHHGYRVYIIRGAAFGPPLCARALTLPLLIDRYMFYTWLPFFVCLVHCQEPRTKAISGEEFTVKAHKTGNLSISDFTNAPSKVFPGASRHR